MARVVRFRVVNGIAVITLDSPPVNVISAAVRAALWDVIQRVRSNDEISAAVFAGAGDLFSAALTSKRSRPPRQNPASRNCVT